MTSRQPVFLSLALLAVTLPGATLAEMRADKGASENPAPQVISVMGSTQWEPPQADDGPAAPESMPRAAPESDAPDSIEKGIGTILDNLFQEMSPALDQITQGLDQAGSRIGPILGDLARQVDDVRNYLPPERLPDGDILIRRKPDAPPAPEVGPSLRGLATPRGEAAGEDGATPRRKVPGPLPSLPQIDL